MPQPNLLSCLVLSNIKRQELSQFNPYPIDWKKAVRTELYYHRNLSRIFRKYEIQAAIGEAVDKPCALKIQELCEEQNLFFLTCLVETFKTSWYHIVYGRSRHNLLLDVSLKKRNGPVTPRRVTSGGGQTKALNYRKGQGLFLGRAGVFNCKRILSFARNLKFHSLNLGRRVAAPQYYTQAVPKEPFVLFPLHFEPEASLYSVNPAWGNLYEIVRRLAIFAPARMWICLKEHPLMQGRRPISEIRKYLQFPNVRILDSRISNRKIVAKAEKIICVSGTFGFDALNAGRKVGLLGDFWYAQHPNVVRLQTPEEIFGEGFARARQFGQGHARIRKFLHLFYATLRPYKADYDRDFSLLDGTQVAEGFVDTLRFLEKTGIRPTQLL